MVQNDFIGKEKHQTESTHKSGETNCTYTHHIVLQIAATYTDARTLGVLSLMAASSESEELTSPANTVPSCVNASEARAQR